MEIRTIDTSEGLVGRDEAATAGPADAGHSTAIGAWAADLVARAVVGAPIEHAAVFVPDPGAGGMRLVAQRWGAGEETGQVVVGSWIVPFDGSITGRVFRTGRAALCADVTMDPDFRSWPGSRTRSSLTVPVGADDEVVAVINVEAPWVAAFSIGDYERLADRAAAAARRWPRPATRA